MERAELESKWTFDSDVTQGYTKVRQAFTREFLGTVRQQMELVTALDVGCGVGYFSKFLSELGFRVVALDGREENATEAKKRYPEITFLAKNVEDPSLQGMGEFDFVLCVGLVYHLENPFRAIRNFYSLTGKLLLVESMYLPGADVGLRLLDEAHTDNQGLSYVAFYPTESCLVKMLYRAGFPFVYHFQRLPDEKQFATTVWRKRSRTFLAASKIALTAPNLVLAEEPTDSSFGRSDPWSTTLSRMLDFCGSKLFEARVLAARFVRPARVGVKDKSPQGPMEQDRHPNLVKRS
jgi:SAM-dependent methyltransferase